MDIITFSEMVIHYKSKLIEIAEETERVDRSLARILEIAEISWDCSASRAFQEKLEETATLLKKAEAEVSLLLKYFDLLTQAEPI